MNNYLLHDYRLSACQVLQSLFVSEYGLRHWALSNTETEYKWGHRMIALIEFCPLIGLVATTIECLAAASFRNREWLFKGSQLECNGDVSVSKVQSIRAELEKKRLHGICFNSKKVNPTVVGGTCTAMSFEFLDSYFEAKKITQKMPDPESNRLFNHLLCSGEKFAKCSPEIRDRQAAYNTIEVQLDVENVDCSKNKIQSLANHRAFKIDHSSKTIDVKTLNQKSLAEEVKSLPEGAYLLRIIKPAHNEKLEECGHSLVFIKEPGLDLLYDPNDGLRNLTPLIHSNVLYDKFKQCLRDFQTSEARFYRFQSI